VQIPAAIEKPAGEWRNRPAFSSYGYTSD